MRLNLETRNSNNNIQLFLEIIMMRLNLETRNSNNNLQLFLEIMIHIQDINISSCSRV